MLRSSVVSALVVLTLSVVPRSTDAFSISPNPAVIGTGGAQLTLTPVASYVGIPPGGVRTGTVFTGDQSATPTIVLEATNTGSITLSQVFFQPTEITDGGWIPDAEPDALVDVNVDRCGPGFTCAVFTGGLAPGATSDLFYLYAHFPVTDPGLSGWNVFISDGTQNLGSGFVTFVVPEPGTGLLLALGVALLGGNRARAAS